ncbi:MAG: hypothetical protein LBP89_02980 [Helicobacteraceae bacterium]|jgi:ATPase subunit of ABC transporter with duplicated ATPase domains|nr:hypothetical protein [Helicobacteraceae bacterium]
MRKKKLERIDPIYETGVTIEASFYPKLFPIVIEDGRTVQKDSRIGIVGRNGGGKSLFIRRFIESRKWGEKLLYLPQEIDVDNSAKPINDVRAMKSGDKGLLMSLIVRLGSDPKTLLQTSLPSPGETRKLLLAIGLLKKPALIVMDEPTNHLDIASIEALEKALKAYNGALLLVSHDRRFLSASTNEIWRFETDADKIAV